MSSQDQIPQTVTTMEAAFKLHDVKELQDEFWRHQVRMGPIAASSPGFICVIGGPIHRSEWLYFSGKWRTPVLMDAWQHESLHKPMQQAAHSRWFSAIYLRKWRAPAESEVFEGPVFCEIAIARQEPILPDDLNTLIDERIHPSIRDHGALPFETLTGEFERQPFQFVGPLQEYPTQAPIRYLLNTHWDTDSVLENWLSCDAVRDFSILGNVTVAKSLQIRHELGERDFLRPDGLQRDAVHATRGT